MRDDIRYNCELRDAAAGLVLGLILDDPGDVLGYRRAGGRWLGGVCVGQCAGSGLCPLGGNGDVEWVE